MAESLENVLLNIYRYFPGIVTQQDSLRGSHIHVPAAAADENYIIVMSYEKNIEGRAAELVVELLMDRVGGTKDKDRACACCDDEAVFYRCSHEQLDQFARYLNYGSLRPMGPERPGTVLSVTPLPALLSHVFTAFVRDYDRKGLGIDLGIWSNILRPLNDNGFDLRELGKRAVLARRAVLVAAPNAERHGWLVREKDPEGRGKILRLTPQGCEAREMGRACINEVESDWRKRFGNDRIDALRVSLAALAAQFEIELPYYLTGYGPADPRITGGGPIAAQLGPPRIPARGEEWPVVLRDHKDDVSNNPLPALLSQVLGTFAIDYEGERSGWFSAASLFLRYIEDEGTTLGKASANGVKGTGKSLLERHLYVTVEPGKPKDMDRRVYLTPKGKRSRDAYPYLVMQVERDWQARYGAHHVEKLRNTLETLDRELDAGLPDYPDINSWFIRKQR